MIARPASAEEADILLAMACDFHAEDGHPLDAAGVAAAAAVAAGEPLSPAFFLVENEVHVGYFIVTLGYSVENGGTDGFIDDLYLIPTARGRGLGRQALALALEAARDLGIRVLLLEVEAANDRAYRLYRSAGFADTGRRLLRLPLT